MILNSWWRASQRNGLTTKPLQARISTIVLLLLVIMAFGGDDHNYHNNGLLEISMTSKKYILSNWWTLNHSSTIMYRLFYVCVILSCCCWWLGAVQLYSPCTHKLYMIHTVTATNGVVHTLYSTTVYICSWSHDKINKIVSVQVLTKLYEKKVKNYYHGTRSGRG